jgi:hypothetical protein
MQLFSGRRWISTLCPVLSLSVFLYTVPVAAWSQLPGVPQLPQLPGAKPPAGGAPEGGAPAANPPASSAPAAAPPAAAAEAGADAQPQPIATPPSTQARMPQSDDQPPFHILVVEGEGAINNIHQQSNRGATVIVEDENKNPLSGVAVSFFLPNDGPSGLFPNGSKVLTVFTDDKGIAMSRTIHFNNLVGIMPIRVTATLFSQSVTATITETNVASGQAIRSYVSPVTRNEQPADHGIHISKKVWITALIVGAGVAAAVVLLDRSSPPSASIGAQPTTGPIVVTH